MLYILCVWNILSDLKSKDTFVQQRDLDLTTPFKKQSPGLLGCTQARLEMKWLCQVQADRARSDVILGSGWESSLKMKVGQYKAK